MDFGDFIFGIDKHLQKSRNFIDVDTGLNLWIKRLSPIAYDTEEMKDARSVAKELLRGSPEKQKTLIKSIEYANLSFEHVTTLYKDFIRIQAYSYSVAKIDVNMDSKISVDDLLLYLNERRTHLVEMTFNLMDFKVGKSIEAETLDFADFVSFVVRFCTMGRHELVRIPT